jgi:DNA-binding transcriptional ArsR family regulator
MVVNQMVDKPVGSRDRCSAEELNKERPMGLPADDQLSKVFSALADPTRRNIVARLTVADATVGELGAPYDVSLQAVSKHLKVLEEAGLVTRTRDAQRRPVHLEAEVFDLMTKWIERYRRQAEERYQRLDGVLAELDDIPSAGGER